MDRIIGVNTIDLGGGRRGFRGKDTVAGIPGTELAAAWHNAVQEEIVGLIELCGGDPSDADLSQLAKALQSGALNYAFATGTANAWTVDPSLAVPAYAAGRVLWVKAPATNTSTTVNVNVSTLGNRRLKQRDGTDPSIGDLTINTWYPTIDDGANIVVLTPLRSEMVTTFKSIPISALSASGIGAVTSNIVTTPGGYGTVVNDLGADGSFNNSTGQLTLTTGGVWMSTCTIEIDTDPAATILWLRLANNGSPIAWTEDVGATGSKRVSVSHVGSFAPGAILQPLFYLASGTPANNYPNWLFAAAKLR